MKKLIILRGNSGSGKTTIAKELQKTLGINTMIISQDVIRRDILNVKDGKNTQALPLIEELLIYGNKNSNIVILEGIFNSEWYKDLFELAVQLYGDAIAAYYFDLPFEETIKRHKTRLKSNEFGEAEMRRWWIEKDYSSVLKEEKITSSESKEFIVDKIYKRISNL